MKQVSKDKFFKELVNAKSELTVEFRDNVLFPEKTMCVVVYRTEQNKAYAVSVYPKSLKVAYYIF